MRAIWQMMGAVALFGVAACGGNAKLTNLDRGSRSPDEFSVLPTKPLSMPPDLAVLPSPTPGGGNITDPTPMADAVGALGGNPAALSDRGIGGADQALVAYAGRNGTDSQIRERLAAEDLSWRQSHGPRVLERLAGSDVYTRAYRRMALDPYAELLRWQRAGARTPSGPSAPTEK